MRSQRMLEEENRQLLQEVRFLREQSRQTADRTRDTDYSHQFTLPPPVVDPLDISQLRETLSEPDRLEPVTQLSQEEIDSSGQTASYLSPVKTLPDQEIGDIKDRSDKVFEEVDETQEKLVFLQELTMPLVESPLIIRTQKKNTATLEAVSTNNVIKDENEKDSIKDQKEDILIEKDKASKRNTIHLQDHVEEVCETEPSYGERKDNKQHFDKVEMEAESYLSQDEIDPEQKDIADRLYKLMMQEEILDKENEKRAKEEAQAIERLQRLKAKTAALDAERERMRRLEALKQEEEIRERRLQYKIKQQREQEERLQILQQEEERLKALEEMKLAGEKRQKIVELKLKEQQEHERKLKFLQEEEERLMRYEKEEQQQQGQEQQLNLKMGVQRKQEEASSLLFQESENLIQHNKVRDTSNVVRPKARKEEEIWKVGVKGETDENLDGYDLSKGQTMSNERDHDAACHMSESTQNERSMIEWLKNKLISLESIVQEKEQSEDQNIDRSYPVHELERKEAYLKNLEKELKKKEEDIKIALKLDKTHEGTNESDTDLKKENKAPKTDFTPYYKPYMSKFSGIDPVPKSECSFEEWKIEVECLINSKMYPDHVINQSLRNSLIGQARAVTVTLGPKATSQEIIDKLESVFGNVATGASVLQEFYSASQGPKESVTLWGIRIEQIVQRAVEKGYISREQKNTMLKDRFWWYLYDNDLRNTTKIYYEQIESFDMLRRKVKAEEYAMSVHNRNKGTTNVRSEEKSKTTTTPEKHEDKSKVTDTQERKASEPSIAAQHQPLLHDSNTKLLKELMEKFEKLNSKVEKMCTSYNQSRRRWWPNQGQRNKSGQGESSKATPKSKEETETKQPLNG